MPKNREIEKYDGKKSNVRKVKTQKLVEKT